MIGRRGRFLTQPRIVQYKAATGGRGDVLAGANLQTLARTTSMPWRAAGVGVHSASSAINTTHCVSIGYVLQNAANACGPEVTYLNSHATCTSIDGDTSKLEEFEATG